MTEEQAGCWCIGNRKPPELSIHMRDKPNWLHRKMMKLCLGIYWLDKDKFKELCK